MSGHLFITQGDLTKLACDAWIVPTDATGHVMPHWHNSLGRDSLAEYADRLTESRAALVRSGKGTLPAVVAVHSGASGKDAAWYAEGLLSAVEVAQSSIDKPRGERRLIAVPLVGVGAGGGHAFRGDIVRAEVAGLQAFVERTGVDMALVTYTRETLAAAQAARRLLGCAWPELSDAQVEQADALAERAREGKLVLFLGSGVSKPAGFPMWKELLEALVADVDPRPDAQEFGDLDVLDQAEIVRRGLGEERFREKIRARFKGDTQALAHQLLAPLPVREAATTNYDTLFEDAWSVVTDGRVAALPQDSPANASRWLLKLHGSVRDDGRELVLCREDYLRLGQRGAALAGVVQAMLLTRHMLFVGFSLTDDTFHKIAHDVRSVLGSADKRPDSRPFGTALTLRSSALAQELWRGDITLTTVKDGRQLELFLDRLLYETADPLGIFTDPTLEGLLSTAELAAARNLRQAVAELPGSGGVALRERLGLS